jgi:tripartite ATP-independent transporter DctP family solute receptor
MENFAELIVQRTQGEVMIRTYAEGLLGQEPDLIEQVKTGRLDLTKASASVLGGVNPAYQVFDIPFLLRDKEHWYKVINGSIGKDLLAHEAGSVLSLTFYDAGARSFYSQLPIRQPEDLRGLKIRVQPSASTVRMIQLLDAEPRPLPWGLVYSALQVGLVDGAENNITALVYGRHAEVVKYFSFTEHTMVPDVLLMNRQAWERLSKSQQDTLRSAAAESSLLQSILWEQAESRSRFEAERMGITFVHPNKAAFVAKLAALKQELAERAGLAGLIAKIEQA